MARTVANRNTRLVTLTTVAVVLACVAGAVNYHYTRLAAEQPKDLSALAAGMAAPPPQTPTVSVQTLEQYLRQNPRDRAARYGLANLYLRSHDYARSLEELSTLRKQDPRDPVVYLRKAAVFKYAGEPDAAEKEIRRALALQPGDERAEELLGEIHMDQRRYREALQVFERRLKARPGSVRSLLGKGRALEQLRIGRDPATVREILAPVERAVELAPADAQALATLARMKFAYADSEKDSTEAEQAALRAVQSDPQHPQPLITLAQIYLARPPTPENLQQVGRYAAQAGMLDQQDPRPPYLVGRLALLQNDVARAAKALELSVRLGPLPETVVQLAVAYRRDGNKERAEHYSRIYERYIDLVGRRDALQAAREREPREVRHYHELARLYLEAGQPDTAEHWLEQARSVRPRDRVRDGLIRRAKEFRKKRHDAPLLPVP